LLWQHFSKLELLLLPLSFWKMILEGNSKPTKRCLRRCLCPRRPMLGFQGGKNSPLPPYPRTTPPATAPLKKRNHTPRTPPNILQKAPQKKTSCPFVILLSLVNMWFNRGLILVLPFQKNKSLVLLIVQSFFGGSGGQGGGGANWTPHWRSW
jgi:hypothetical protein